MNTEISIWFPIVENASNFDDFNLQLYTLHEVTAAEITHIAMLISRGKDFQRQKRNESWHSVERFISGRCVADRKPSFPPAAKRKES